MNVELTEEEAKLFYIKESDIHGRGIFAKKSIKKGTYLGEYKGPTTTRNGMHVLWVEDEEDKWIGRNGKSALRFLNHNTKPDAEFDGFELFSIKAIKTNQEIMIDYGEEP
ncbi:MAG: SET domain-containing protein [Woeseiaceae bacterium]